jgi:hypothetical protein
VPYKDPAAQREYQRQWMANRRAEYLADRSCVLCGSTDALEIDHSNPRLKVEHRIWSWSRPRLEAELAKCIVVCHRCHNERHQLERPKHGAGGYKRGCRCDVCQGWKDAAARRERAKRTSAAGGAQVGADPPGSPQTTPDKEARLG